MIDDRVRHDPGPIARRSPVNENRFTLHRLAWRSYRRLPKLLQIWIAVALAVTLIFEVPSLLEGASSEQAVRTTIIAAIREATGSDPAASCAALSPAGLDQVIATYDAALTGATPGGDPLSVCRQLVAQLRQRATPQQLADVGRGSVRSVQFLANGTALALYVAADDRLAADLTLSRTNGRWLVDKVMVGTVLMAIAPRAGG